MSYFCSLFLQDLNEAYGIAAKLHKFGLPHMFVVVKLFGSYSHLWLVRVVLDYLAQ